MKNHISDQIKIIGAMTIASLITIVFSNIFFIGNTSRINLQYLAKLFPKKIDSQKKLEEFNKLPVSAMTHISQGIYAKEDKQNNIVYIRVTKDANWQEKIIESNGYKILLRYPKGTIK